MNEVWLYSFIGVLATSLVSLVGVLALVIKKEKLQGVIFLLVALAGGVMLGDVFIHIIPEIVKEFGFGLKIALYFLGSILFFYILEEFLAWRHCHDIDCENHPKKLAGMSLVGGSLHNMTDGMMIAGSFLVAPGLGLATTIAVLMHEVPQELGDFGILLRGGYTIKRALFYNFLSAIAAFLGMLFVLIVGTRIAGLAEFILPFTGGGLLYIASCGIIPELHREARDGKLKALLQLLAFVAGVVVMVGLK